MTALLELHPFDDASRAWAREFFRQRWASNVVVSRGVAYEADLLPGFIAYHNGEKAGIATYRVADGACELVTIDSMIEGVGVGTALIEAVREAAGAAGCARLWLITSNDNLSAQRFYQKRGFQMVAVYPNAIDESRKIKPEIPLIGDDGIPIRDEIELEMRL